MIEGSLAIYLGSIPTYSSLFQLFVASRPMFLLVLSREWMGLGEWNDY